MNEKHVLAILGSPHVKGTTAAMLDCAIQRAEKKGYTVTKINLYEKNLSFCTGCRACPCQEFIRPSVGNSDGRNQHIS